MCNIFNKCQIGKLKVNVELFWGCLAFNKSENKLSIEYRKELRKIFIQNYLWINAWDLSEDDDYSKDALVKQFNHEVKVGRIFQEEADYLIANLVSDYYKNKDNYPSFKEII